MQRTSGVRVLATDLDSGPLELGAARLGQLPMPIFRVFPVSSMTAVELRPALSTSLITCHGLYTVTTEQGAP